MDVNVLIVLYKKNFLDSIAVKTLLHNAQFFKKSNHVLRLYVWNNSPEYKMPSDSESVSFYEGNNEYLPNIYNNIAGRVFSDIKTCSNQLLMISDDDTDYSNFDFLDVLNKIDVIVSGKNPREFGVFLPKVYSNNILVSPGNRLLFKGRLLNSVKSGFLSSKNMLAINSGTIITNDCYQKMKPLLFNPELRFYGTDTDFFVRYEQKFPYVYVLENKIMHSLSEHSLETFGRIYFRWQDHIFAMRKTFQTLRVPERLLLMGYIFYLKIKLSIKYKSTAFLLI